MHRQSLPSDCPLSRADLNAAPLLPALLRKQNQRRLTLLGVWPKDIYLADLNAFITAVTNIGIKNHRKKRLVTGCYKRSFLFHCHFPKIQDTDFTDFPGLFVFQSA